MAVPQCRFLRDCVTAMDAAGARGSTFVVIGVTNAVKHFLQVQ